MSLIDVIVDDRQSDHDCDVETLRRLLADALCDQGVQPPAEVGLSFVDIDEMTQLNQEHMRHAGASGPTDVLAFPIDGGAEQPDGQPAMVGDIVICPAVAAQAQLPLSDELAVLTVHGALHLLGHDHYVPAEAAVMQLVQQDLLKRFAEQ